MRAPPRAPTGASMDRTNRNAHRAAPTWWQFPADVYLDHRRQSWVLVEELGHVRFHPSAGVVLVHRKRAENIAAALLGGRDVLMLEDALALPARTPPEPVRLPPPPAADPTRESQSLSADTRTSRWRDIWGWIGIAAGVAVLVTALAVPLDDSGLALAAALVLRGGRLILDVDS